MNRRIALLTIMLPLSAVCHAGGPWKWSELPPLPDSIGFAGPYAGVVDSSLVVVGGANFPEAPPWEKGIKVWHRDAFVLDEEDEGWRLIDDLLPRPLGYGASITIPAGLVCIGGSNETGHFSDVFLIKRGEKNFEIVPFPDLPQTIAHCSAACIDDIVYVAGGLETPTSDSPLKCFWRLDLKPPVSECRWEALEPWPGPPRFLATAGTINGAFFLFGGVNLEKDSEDKPIRKYLRDTYRFEAHNGWSRIADLPTPIAASPAPAVPLNQTHLAILGGDTGEMAHRIEELRGNHPGFSRDILTYDSQKNTWAVAGKVPHPASVTTSAVQWRNRFVLPTGEIKPGVRTPSVIVGHKQLAP